MRLLGTYYWDPKTPMQWTGVALNCAAYVLAVGFALGQLLACRRGTRTSARAWGLGLLLLTLGASLGAVYLSSMAETLNHEASRYALPAYIPLLVFAGAMVASVSHRSRAGAAGLLAFLLLFAGWTNTRFLWPLSPVLRARESARMTALEDVRRALAARPVEALYVDDSMGALVWAFLLDRPTVSALTTDIYVPTALAADAAQRIDILAGGFAKEVESSLQGIGATSRRTDIFGWRLFEDIQVPRARTGWCLEADGGSRATRAFPGPSPMAISPPRGPRPNRMSRAMRWSSIWVVRTSGSPDLLAFRADVRRVSPPAVWLGRRRALGHARDGPQDPEAAGLRGERPPGLPPASHGWSSSCPRGASAMSGSSRTSPSATRRGEWPSSRSIRSRTPCPPRPSAWRRWSSGSPSIRSSGSSPIPSRPPASTGRREARCRRSSPTASWTTTGPRRRTGSRVRSGSAPGTPCSSRSRTSRSCGSAWRPARRASSPSRSAAKRSSGSSRRSRLAAPCLRPTGRAASRAPVGAGSAPRTQLEAGLEEEALVSGIRLWHPTPPGPTAAQVTVSRDGRTWTPAEGGRLVPAWGWAGRTLFAVWDPLLEVVLDPTPARYVRVVVNSDAEDLRVLCIRGDTGGRVSR